MPPSMRRSLPALLLALGLARCNCAYTCPDVPCDPGLHCNAKGECVTNGLGSDCKLDQDCGEGLVCKASVCAACSAAADCREAPGRPYCDAASSRCVACASALDCSQDR